MFENTLHFIIVKIKRFESHLKYHMLFIFLEKPWYLMPLRLFAFIFLLLNAIGNIRINIIPRAYRRVYYEEFPFNGVKISWESEMEGYVTEEYYYYYKIENAIFFKKKEFVNFRDMSVQFLKVLKFSTDYKLLGIIYTLDLNPKDLLMKNCKDLSNYFISLYGTNPCYESAMNVDNHPIELYEFDLGKNGSMTILGIARNYDKVISISFKPPLKTFECAIFSAQNEHVGDHVFKYDISTQNLNSSGSKIFRPFKNYLEGIQMKIIDAKINLDNFDLQFQASDEQGNIYNFSGKCTMAPNN